MSILPLFSPTIAVTAEFTDSSVDDVGRTIYTFTAQALGTVKSNRKILVPVNGFAQTRTVSTLTVAGISASLVVRASGANETSEIWLASVPTGTTGDVVVTWSGAQDACGIGIIAAYDMSSTATDTGTSTATATASDTLNIPQNGLAIGMTCLRSDTNRTFVWTGITELYDEIVENNSLTQTGAMLTFAAAQTGLAITCAPSAAGLRNPVMVLASWGPA